MKKKDIQKLEKLISVSRQRLHLLWNERGFTDAIVLKASIELDNLFNRYQKQKGEIPYLDQE